MPLKASEKEEEKKVEATVSPAAAREISSSNSNFIRTGWLFRIIKTIKNNTKGFFSVDNIVSPYFWLCQELNSTQWRISHHL